MFVAEAYYKQIDNQLSSIELANHNAFNSVRSTKTSLVNYGLEFSLNVRPLSRQSNWDLNVATSLAINKDVIAKLPNEVRQIINSDAEVVNKLGSNAMGNYLYVYKGVYATDEDVPVNPLTGERLRMGGNTSTQAYFKAGDPIWVDVNGDYIIDEKDKVIVGNSQPRMTGGISINLRYKAFSINTNCSFTLRRDIINKALADRFRAYGTPVAGKVNLLRHIISGQKIISMPNILIRLIIPVQVLFSLSDTTRHCLWKMALILKLTVYLWLILFQRKCWIFLGSADVSLILV